MSLSLSILCLKSRGHYKIVYRSAIEKNADLVFFSYISESSRNTIKKQIYSENRCFDEVEVRTELLSNTIGLVGKQMEHMGRLDILVSVWGKLYRNSIIQKQNIRFISYKEVPSECQLFNIDFFTYSSKAFYLNEFLYHYRRNNDSSITKGYRPELFNKWLFWYEHMQKYLNENNVEKDLKDAFINRIYFTHHERKRN